MKSRLPQKMESQLDAIQRICSRQMNPNDFREELLRRVLRAVPADMVAFFLMDPVTCLAVDSEGYQVPDGAARRYFERIYLKNELISFPDMRERGEIVSLMSDYTGGDLDRDPRYREFFKDFGYRHDVRVCFATGRHYWGALCMARGSDVRDYREEELAFLRRISRPVGDALRNLRALSEVESPADRSHAIPESTVLLLDKDDRVIFSSCGIDALFAEFAGSPSRLKSKVLGPDGSPLPTVLHSVNAHLQLELSRADEEEFRTPKLTVRGRSGAWWTVTALEPDESNQGDVASVLVVSRSRPGDTAPVLLAAYGLTDREQEVVRWIRSGYSTTEIAERMFVSPYTVQDHLKKIFAKVGVASRGELMFRIFQEESPLARQGGGAGGVREGA